MYRRRITYVYICKICIGVLQKTFEIICVSAVKKRNYAIYKPYHKSMRLYIHFIYAAR